jgi:enoyl-CoA hydratase/carnithine racemase
VLLCSDGNGVRTLTLDRPQRKNAINRDLWIALADVPTAAGNDREVRAVVITGAGGAFCSGADIAAPDDSHPMRARRMPRSPSGGSRRLMVDGRYRDRSRQMREALSLKVKALLLLAPEAVFPGRQRSGYR